MQDALKIIVASTAIVSVLCMFGLAIRYSWTDAKRRGKSPLLVCVFVFCCFPLGLIAWLLFRPELITSEVDQYRQPSVREG
jgi:hypothetical protein